MTNPSDTKNKQLFWLHPSHRVAMRKVGIMLALLTFGVLLPALFPALSEIGDVMGYLSLHMLLETVVIVIAMLVFAVGWNSYQRGLSGNILLLACACLGVAVLDFSHTLSFAGMPDFITPSGPEKAIYFWLAARTLAAVTLLAVAVLPWRTLVSAISRYVMLSAVLILVGGMHWLFFFHADLLPQTFVTDQGLTPFKVGYEYGLIALNLLTASTLWFRMRKPQPFNAAGLFGAVCVMALSEYLFTVYSSVSDVYNFFGHIYKAVSYLFLYRAIFVVVIQYPYIQLQASQNQLQATLNALPDLLFEVDSDGTYLNYHSPHTELLFTPAEKMLGRTVQQILPKTAADVCMSAIREADRQGYSWGKQITLDLPDGSHCFELSVSRKLDVPGTERRFLVLSRDITERRKLEENLAKSESLLKDVIAAIPARVFWKDKDLRYMGCNPAFARDANLASPEDIIGKDDFQMVWQDQAALYQDDDRRVMDTGVAKLDYEEPQTTPDGGTIWLSTSKVPLLDESDQVVGILGIYQDITQQKLAMSALRDSEASLSDSQRIAALGSYVLDISAQTWKSSVVLDQLFGIDEHYKRTVDGWLALVHPDDRKTMREYLTSEVLRQGKPFEMEYRIVRHDDKSVLWVHGLGKLEFDASGHPVKMQGTIQDITMRKRVDDTLLKLSMAVEQSPNSIVITDLLGRIEYVNEAFSNVTGYTLSEVSGKNSRILQSGKTPKETYIEMWAHLTRGESWQGELTNSRKDGTEYVEHALISPVRQADGRITNYLAVKSDITEAKQSAARIERLAHFDQLTGLPNRSMLDDRFRFSLSLAQRSSGKLVVMYLDLDHFKNINDALGHSVGDLLLMEVAVRIKSVLRDEDTVSRQGGDEFVLLFPGTDAHGAAHIASKLVEVVSQPCLIEHHELTTTPSIGIAIYPDDGKDFETLSKNADAAMYYVKQEGRNNFRFFTPTMHAHSARGLQLVNGLRNALARNEFSLHYQPQISIQDGHVVGAEALLRWQHPEWGMISPAEFIPIAEDSGQIVQIGEWVLRTAVQQLKVWLDAGLQPMVMAVNLSAVQFHQSNIVELVNAILDEAAVPHQYLELELTEAVAMNSPQAAIEVMDKLHEKGIRMSIDDFGTGYSSLSYLKKFKVYKLKIDQSFVRDITDDPEDKAIVSAIINMASSLGIQTIAEGVETSAQLAFLRLQGCDEVQGYYFSKPLPASEFEKFARNV